MSPSGECIARQGDMEICVPFGIPGEVVEVEIVHRRRHSARTRIINLLQAGPDRVAPPCPHFGFCGGCNWQHIAYDAQLRFKNEIVRGQLERIGHLVAPDVRKCIASPNVYHYRNRIQLVASARGRLGYRKSTHNGHTVVEIDHCAIAAEPLNQLVRTTSQAGNVDLRMDDQNAYAISTLGESHQIFQIAVGSHTYRVTGNTFFQVNTAVAGLLVQTVINALRVQSGLPSQRILDLYCGVGLFTLPIAHAGAMVMGVDSSPISTTDARHNLTMAGLKGIVLTEDVATALRQAPIRDTHWDAVVVDPPRTGMAYEALSQLMALRPEKIVYVSCNPITLARDARLLNRNGWALRYAQPLDMFPQTHHVEVVAVFDI